MEIMSAISHASTTIALALSLGLLPTAAAALTADCNANPSDALGNALAMAMPDDVIDLLGTCTQDVEIQTDGITIQGGAVMGQLFVKGARRVTIQDLHIVGSSVHGIAAVNTATLTVRNVLIENVGHTGVILTNNSSGELDNVTIRSAGGGVTAEGGAKVVVFNGSLIEQVGSGVLALGGALAYLHHVTIRNAGTGVTATEHSYVEVFFDSVIEESADTGIGIDQGSVGSVADTTIQNNGGTGVVVTNGSSAHISVRETETRILGNAGGGIDVNQGSSATIANTTIDNNGEVGVHVGYSSTATLDGNAIQAAAVPVSIDFGASALLRGNTVTATAGEDAALDMPWSASVRLAGGNTLNASPNGFHLPATGSDARTAKRT
jgi:parallel beta-helix repeat protein